MFRTFGVIGCALWNGALDAVKGIVVVVQGLQGYDVQLNNEERVREVRVRVQKWYQAMAVTKALLLRALLSIRPSRNDRFRSL